MQKEFYGCINNPAAYHPWPLSEGLMAEAYAADSGITVSPGIDGSGEAVIWKGPGSWVEYDVEIDSPGSTTLDLRYHGAGPSTLRFTLGDAGSGSAVSADFPGGNAWDTLAIVLPATPGAAGPRRLRVQCTQGTVALDWLHSRVP